jgi:hypothetical protein
MGIRHRLPLDSYAYPLVAICLPDEYKRRMFGQKWKEIPPFMRNPHRYTLYAIAHSKSYTIQSRL